MTGVIKMIKESFSSRLRKALEMRGVSQSELSKRTGIGKSSISTYLKGEYKAKQDKVNLLSTALNVSPAWLMGYDVPMVPGTKSEERNYDILQSKKERYVNMKQLLSTKSLITHMKGKGIHFDIINEQEAMHFLSEHNYYFKLASYRKNYDKVPFGKKQGAVY